MGGLVGGNLNAGKERPSEASGRGQSRFGRHSTTARLIGYQVRLRLCNCSKAVLDSVAHSKEVILDSWMLVSSVYEGHILTARPHDIWERTSKRFVLNISADSNIAS